MIRLSFFSVLRRRGPVSALALLVALVLPLVVFASEVNVAVVDVTVPMNSVTLVPGANANITINMSVTGNQEGTATFEVYRDWTLAAGSFSGSNPQEFTVAPRSGGAPATTFSTNGTLSVAAGQTDGTFTLAVGVFDITNTNATGAKLSAGSPSNYQVIVASPSDRTSPVITPNLSGNLGNNGWYISDVTVTWDVSDSESTITSMLGCDPTTIISDTPGVTLTCSATSAGGTNAQSVTIKRDATVPTIAGNPTPAANDHGWNNENVAVNFICQDTMSGVASCGPDQILSGEGADQAATGTAFDNAGNSASTTVGGINIDKTAPTNITFVGDISDGDSFYFGSVPAAPTCTADGDISGLTAAGCLVSGYSVATGLHTLTASATDFADNTGTFEISYNVLAWTLYGFYNPVNMGDSVWNTIKGGSTVPLKFEIFAGSTELTEVSRIDAFSTRQVSCNTAIGEDPVEIVTTGGTSLRYDATAGQFIQNWQTPKQPGKCFKVTMTTDDGSSLEALFKLK